MGKFTNLNRIKKQAELTETLATRVVGDIGKHCEARKTHCFYSLPTGTPKKTQIQADTPTAEDAVQVVRCKDCPYFEPVWGNEFLGRCTQAKACFENRYIWDYCSNSRKTAASEPQPDGIQFRTIDDLGRICIPRDIRDRLGIKPGTECAMYSTDELTPEQIIVIRRKER